MIIFIATFCFCSLWLSTSEVDARLPPKLLKTVNNVGKALYAGRYGYSVVPIPPHITLQANVARKEIHAPVRLRKKRRPIPRRPQYASKYQDYTQPTIKKKRRVRRPQKQRAKPRPPYRDPDYYDDELEDDSEYEYDERSNRYNNGKDYDDFVAQHSELYSSGYNPGRGKKGKYRDDNPQYAEQSASHYIRKPKPNVKSWTGVMRPSSKLYSAAVGAPSRPVVPKDEERYRHEEEEEEEDIPRTRYTREKKQRPRYRDEDSYEKERYKERTRQNFDDYHNPDNIYHDRIYESKQKRQERGVEDKEPNPRDKHFKEEWRSNYKNNHREESWVAKDRPDWKVREQENKRENQNYEDWRNDKNPERNKYHNDQTNWWSAPEPDIQETRTALQPIFQREQWQKHPQNDGWRPGERPDQSNNQHEFWTQEPVQVQTVQWVEPSSQPSYPSFNSQSLPSPPPPSTAPQPPHSPPSPSPTIQQHTIAIFEKPRGPVRQENWPGLKSDYRNDRWNDQNGQNSQKPSQENGNQRYKTKRRKQQRNNETQRYRNENREREEFRDENQDQIVTQRVVGGTVKWNNQENQDSQQNWKLQGFRQKIKTPNETHGKKHQQWEVDTLSGDSSIDEGSREGDIVYGSRINDGNQNQWRKELDIGFGQGMEVLVDDKVAGWQVY